MIISVAKMWFGLGNRVLHVSVGVDADPASVSEVYLEATFASDTDRSQDITDVDSPVRVRVTRRYTARPGEPPSLEVKATSGATSYPVVVGAAVLPDDPSVVFVPQSTAAGGTNRAVLVPSVSSQAVG